MDVTEATLSDLIPAVLDRLPELLADIREAFRDEWPDYADFLAEHETDVAPAAALAIRRLITLAATGETDDGVEGELFEEIGRIQWREGKDLTTLLSAYRTGVRVFWRRVSATALEVGMDPGTVAALAEAVFFYVDRLSSSSAHGYVVEQSRAAAERERLRDELVTLLLSDRADVGEVTAAARRAGWALPETAVVVLVDPDAAVGRDVLTHADPTSLPIRRPTATGLVVADPDGPGRRGRLATRLRGAGATVGPAVPPERLPASLHIAEIGVRLRSEGVVAADPLFTDEHLDAIIVHRDRRLLEALRGQVLAPLDASPTASRQRLSETLAAWLRHMGDRQRVAAQLHVHPQTVSYRMNRLHDLFGADLDDPDIRARLVLALAWS